MASFHVLPFSEEIDIAERQRVESALAVIEDFDPQSIVILDLSSVKYVDTTLLKR